MNLLAYLYFSNDETPKASKLDNLNSVTINEIRKASEIKSIRIYLNDGSCQGFKKCINVYIDNIY